MNKFVFILVLLGVSTAAQSLSQTKLISCQSCHGQNGISQDPTCPHLAGQHKRYLIKQLGDMKAKGSGVHKEAVLKELNEQDIEDLAAYYASRPSHQRQPNQLESSQFGKKIYKNGDYTKGIPACMTCHGVDGMGNAKLGFPRIAGLGAPYIINALQAFKEARRSNDLNHLMQSICQRLSEPDMKALADYIEQL